jgi:hypothetical protein
MVARRPRPSRAVIARLRTYEISGDGVVTA